MGNEGSTDGRERRPSLFRSLSKVLHRKSKFEGSSETWGLDPVGPGDQTSVL